MEPLNSMFGNPYKGSPPKHCSRRRSIGKAVISVNAIQAVPATAKAKKGVFFPEHREIGIGWFFVTTFDEQKQSHRPRLIARKINSKLFEHAIEGVTPILLRPSLASFLTVHDSNPPGAPASRT